MKIIASTLCAIATSAFATGVPTITTLGLGEAESVSADGSVVTGTNGSSAWAWTASGGMTTVPSNGAISAVISANGSVLAGVTVDANNNYRQCYQPFPVTGGGWNFLPTIGNANCTDAFISSSVCISGDGTVLGGSMPNGGCQGFDTAVTWTQAGGLVEWFSPYSALSRITGMSADGRTYIGEHYMDIEGSVSHHGCFWRADGSFEPISTTLFHGTLSAVNSSGTIVAGDYNPTTGNAYTWTADGGFHDLGGIDGMEFVFNKRPTSMTDDGRIVIGEAGDFWSMEPVIWIQGQNGQRLKSYLQNLGLTGIDSYYFLSAAAITPDGRYIVGHYALDDGTFDTHAYLVDLEADAAPCPADFNQDGGVDGGDVEAFFSAWEGATPDADVNQDGGIDGSDVETFFAAWEAGGCN